jgi:hypothetical protein
MQSRDMPRTSPANGFRGSMQTHFAPALSAGLNAPLEKDALLRFLRKTRAKPASAFLPWNARELCIPQLL